MNRPIIPAPGGKIVLGAVVAALALTTAWFAGERIADRDEIASLGTELKLAVVSAQLARSQLAERTLFAERMINELGVRLHQANNLSRLKVATLTATPGFAAGARAVVLWDPAQTGGWLTVENMSPSGDYQLWISLPGVSRPVRSAAFQVGPDGTAFVSFPTEQTLPANTGYSVSWEKEGAPVGTAGPVALRSH